MGRIEAMKREAQVLGCTGTRLTHRLAAGALGEALISTSYHYGHGRNWGHKLKSWKLIKAQEMFKVAIDPKQVTLPR